MRKDEREFGEPLLGRPEVSPAQVALVVCWVVGKYGRSMDAGHRTMAGNVARLVTRHAGEAMAALWPEGGE